MELLTVEKVKKIYKGKKKTQVKAVNDVSFSIEKGKCIGLVGESGCGKSTLGRLITGLEKTTEGHILWKNISVDKISRKSPMRREIQMVFQNSFEAVNPKAKAKDIIAEPLKNFYHLSGENLEKRIDELLGWVGIDLAEKEKYPRQFSGGQLQRICIARMLASNPELLVLDEPLSSLDVSVQAQILNLFADLKEKLSLTYLLISHDLEAVYYLSDEILIMYGGKIMEHIERIEDFDKLKHPYTQRLLMSSFSYRHQYEEISEVYREKPSEDGCPYYQRCPYATGQCKEEMPTLREIEKGHFIACWRK